MCMTFSATVRNRLQIVSSVFERPADPAFLALQARNAVEVDRFDPLAHSLNARMALVGKGF